MADLVQGTAINGDSVPLVYGMITRLVGDNTITRAQADSTAHLQGLYGVVLSGSIAPGSPSTVLATNAAKSKVLLETGLTPSAGQTVYVSSAVAGRGTIAAPANAIAIGVIEDASSYTRDGRVYVGIQIAAGANAGGAPVVMNGILVGVNQLASLPSSGFGESQQVWVQTVRSTFLLQQSSLTVDNSNVVAAVGKPGFQWIRRVEPNSYWWSATTFPTQIDPANSSGVASDEATGLPGAPLKSWAEWYRRTTRAQLSFSPIVTLLSDTPDNDDIVVDVDGFDASVNMTIQGTVAVATTQTVGTAQARTSSPAPGTANQIPVTSFDFTPYLGSLLRVQGTSNYAGISKLLTTTTANDTGRLGELWNTATFAQASSTGIGTGATIEIVAPPKGPLRYTVLGKINPTVQDIRFDGTGNVSINTTRCTSTWIARRLVFGGTAATSLKGYDFGGGFTACVFRQPVSVTSAQSENYLGCVFMGTSSSGINAHNAMKVVFNGCVGQASAQQVASGNVRVTLDYGSFDLPAGKIGIELPFDAIGGNMKFVSGRHYGSGNSGTANIWAINPPGTITYPSATPPTCDAGNGVAINGVNTPIGSLPVALNTATGCGVFAI